MEAADILDQAEQAFVNHDSRKGLTNILMVLRNDFTNDQAWHLLHKVMRSNQPFETFQMEIAERNFPDKVPLIVENQMKKIVQDKPISDNVKGAVQERTWNRPNRNQNINQFGAGGTSPGRLLSSVKPAKSMIEPYYIKWWLVLVLLIGPYCVAWAGIVLDRNFQFNGILPGLVFDIIPQLLMLLGFAIWAIRGIIGGIILINKKLRGSAWFYILILPIIFLLAYLAVMGIGGEISYNSAKNAKSLQKKCIHCKSWIPVDAARCQNCGQIVG